MEYSTWSRFEKVPLSNGIITRRTGLHTMKSPEEVCAYYRDHFGPYWFNEVPKTDNTYSPTSKYYGCTLAPGIPLIPNLSRRPLRSYSGSYKYSFESSLSEDFSTTNHYNTRLENKLFNGENQENGYSFVGLTCTPSPGVLGTTVDSDSDCDDVQFYKRSQNTVTWFSWIITTFTTITTVITRPFTRKTHSQNNISMRMPLKQHRQIPWYQYPVLWLYRLALLVHQVDVWFWSKVYSALGVDSWGTPKQRRKWTLILLLLPILLWAGVFIADCSFPSSETWELVFNTTNWESAFFSPSELMT